MTVHDRGEIFPSIPLVVCLQRHLALPIPKHLQGSAARTGFSLKFSNPEGIELPASTGQFSSASLSFPTCKMLLILWGLPGRSGGSDFAFQRRGCGFDP